MGNVTKQLSGWKNQQCPVISVLGHRSTCYTDTQIPKAEPIWESVVHEDETIHVSRTKSRNDMNNSLMTNAHVLHVFLHGDLGLTTAFYCTRSGYPTLLL